MIGGPIRIPRISSGAIGPSQRYRNWAESGIITKESPHWPARDWRYRRKTPHVFFADRTASPDNPRTLSLTIMPMGNIRTQDICR